MDISNVSTQKDASSSPDASQLQGNTPIYSCTLERKNWQRMGPRDHFSPLIRLSNEPKNKKVQLAVFEKIRFEVFPYVN